MNKLNRNNTAVALCRLPAWGWSPWQSVHKGRYTMAANRTSAQRDQAGRESESGSSRESLTDTWRDPIQADAHRARGHQNHRCNLAYGGYGRCGNAWPAWASSRES